jgi:hypothetical protein
MEVSISDAIHHLYSRANMEGISPYSHVNSDTPRDINIRSDYLMNLRSFIHKFRRSPRQI